MNLCCSKCLAVNRVPEARLRDKPVCGKCSQSLLPSFPIDLMEDQFAKFIARTDVPVVVDFWAPWCGPCRMMSPAFAKAAAQLSPQIILAKLNTEEAPQTSAQFAISAIPTMILFKNGNEVSRQSGVMNTEQIAQFARNE